MNLHVQRDISCKLKVFEHDAKSGNVDSSAGILVFQEMHFINESEHMRHMERKD